MTKKEETKIKESKAPVKKIQNKVTQQLIYCGPTLKNLQQYSVFKGNLPAHVTKHVEAHPVISSLLVDPKDLPSVRKNIGIKGTRENQLFLTILAQTKGASMNDEL